MAKNSNLTAAKTAKNDEFYTQLTDIEKEMRHYRKHFEGKTVLCNCNDPFESNFFKYFVLNFNKLKLKKLITTCYEGSAVAEYRNGKAKPYKAVVTTVHDTTGDGGVDMEDVRNLFELGKNELTELEGDGDFRSSECLKLLDEADIVVTNPPFSLFREYVKILIDHKKKFIIMGNINAVTYKEFFPLIKNGLVWPRASFNKTMEFILPDDYQKWNYRTEDGRKVGKVPTMAWYTNLDLKKRHEELILVKRYTPKEYPHYDNYNAIEVSKVVNIPCDYAGIMGVLITFLDYYNPNQFEILDMGYRGAGSYKYRTKVYTAEDASNYSDLNATTVYVDANGKYKNTYFRILIRNKHPKLPKGA